MQAVKAVVDLGVHWLLVTVPTERHLTYAQLLEGSTPLCRTPPAAVTSFRYPLPGSSPFFKKQNTKSPMFLLYSSLLLTTLTFSLKSLFLFK
jgi:hypothetical protein